MTTQELSVSDATIWSVTLKSSLMILESSFTLIYDIYITGITYDNCNMFITQSTAYNCLKANLKIGRSQIKKVPITLVMKQLHRPKVNIHE